MTMGKSGPYIVESMSGPCKCPLLYPDDEPTEQHWHLVVSHPRLPGEFYLNHLVPTDDRCLFLTSYIYGVTGKPWEARVFETVDAADDWLDGLRGDEIWHGGRRQTG